MKTCKSEQAFSKALMRVFESAIRIESGTTSVGIPDVYYWNTWLELKNEKHLCRFPYKVHWRPGQQAFAMHHLMYTGVPTFTVIRFSDCIALVPMLKYFSNNTITADDVIKINNIKVLKETIDEYCKRYI